MIVEIIFLIVLGILSYIDIKKKEVISIVMTSVLLLSLIYNYNQGVVFGIMAGVFALLMWEFSESNKTSFGLADIKLMIAIGFFITSLTGFIYFLLFFAITQTCWIYVFRTFIKNKGLIPFIPVFFVVFCELLAVGAIG